MGAVKDDIHADSTQMFKENYKSNHFGQGQHEITP